MACRLSGVKPLPDPILNHCQLDTQAKKQLFIQENAFDNLVWDMMAILSWPQCVNDYDMILIALLVKEQ